MPAKPRIWIASELYYPEETSTGYFVTRIAEGLAGDFDIHVLSGLPSYSERHVAVARYEERRGTKIHRMRSTRFDKDRLALRVLNLATFSITAFFFALVKLRRGDIVMALTNPPTLPFVMMVAAKLRGAKLTLLVHDVYPEVLAAAGMLKPTNLLYRMLAALSSWLFRRFDRVYVLGRDMEEVIARKLKDRAGRMAIIPNWGDVEEISPLPRAENRLLAETGLADKFIVQFSGNIGRTHDIESILAAAEELKSEERVHFLFIGYGGKTNMIRSEADGKAMANVTLLPRQPRELLRDMLNAADLSVIAFVDQMYGISVPSRMYNVLAAGVPIAAIADPRSELALTVAENEAGWLVGGGDAPTLAALIRRLATSDRDEARRRGANGRAAAEARYTLGHVLDLYRKDFAALAAR